MRFVKFIAIAVLPLALAACQSLSSVSNGPQPMESSRQSWEHHAPGCQGDDCPLVNIDLQLPKGDAALNARIEHDLLMLTRMQADAPLPASLQDYEREFLADAQSGWSSYLQAKIIDQHDRLLVVELSSYVFTGGAHGIPGRALINYDRQTQQVLSLQDMLLPGTEDAFWDAARVAHQDWLEANGLAEDAEYRKNWPFERTANIALLGDEVMLKYDVYSIAPYSFGHPVLHIPYSRLGGILKPWYFPNP